jgi:hypothetical protein
VCPTRWLAAMLTVVVGTPALAAVTSVPGARLDHGACRVDERIAAIDLTATPGSARVGEPTLLTFRMNVFCAGPIAWRIEVAGRVLASGTHEGPPAPGGILTVAATWTPTAAGEIPLKASADPENALGEPDVARKNNAVTRTVTVTLPSQPAREPDPSPTPIPTPPPPPDGRGEPASKGTCTAWERRVASRGEGLIAVRRARGAPSGFDYVECTRRLGLDVAKAHCTPADRRQLTKKTWYLQPGDLELVPQTVDCR